MNKEGIGYLNIQAKSERNQRICEQLRFERKQRVRTRSQLPAPRFAPHVILPEVPEGMVLHKFYGEPVLLPAITEGEELFGKTPYTQRQFEVLGQLERERLSRRLKENTIRTFGIYID